MLTEFGRAIRRGSGHIYTSILPFSPSCRLKEQYGHAMPSDYVIRGSPACWNSTHCTIDLPAIVGSITYSRDGNLIAAGTRGGVYIFNSFTGAEVISFTKSDRSVCSVAFSPDGCRLAATAGNQAVIWDVTTGVDLVTLEGHTEVLFRVAFASDGVKAITGSTNNTLRVWNSYNGDLLSSRSDAGNWPFCQWEYYFVLSPDSNTIARLKESDIEIWDWINNNPLRILAAPSCNHRYYAVSFLPGNVQLTAQTGEALDIWDYQVGSWLKSIAIRERIYVSPFGYHGVQLSTLDGYIKIWDTKTWSIVGEFATGNDFIESREDDGYGGALDSFAFSPNGCMLAYSPRATHIGVWELISASNGPGGSIDSMSRAIVWCSISASSDGSQVVGSGPITMDRQDRELPEDNKYLLKVWNLNRASFPKTRVYHTRLWLIDCSPDAQLFMSAEETESELLRIPLI